MERQGGPRSEAGFERVYKGEELMKIELTESDMTEILAALQFIITIGKTNDRTPENKKDLNIVQQLFNKIVSQHPRLSRPI